MSAKKESEALGGCLTLLVGLPLSIFLNGWALQTLWAWFVVPEFGVKPLSWIGAFGIAAIVGFLAKGTRKKDENDDTSIWVTTGAVIVAPLLVVGVCWVVLKIAGGA